ncbi:MAG: hypothetical protein IPM16_10330 [Chloroflexi bacterium]|nr:hypothetical protein [Chloroflexota bacterium]
MFGLAHYQAVLAAVGEDYHTLPLGAGAVALVTRRGGRVLGVFPPDGGANLLWTSSAFDSSEAFRAFTARTDGWAWNLGGDRCWIAPEISFNVRDRRDFAGTWQIPYAMDPGAYELGVNGDKVSLSANMSLTAYRHGAELGRARLRLVRTLLPSKDPLDVGSQFGNSITYAGYEQYVTLSSLDSDLPVPVEMWNLVQLNAGGTLLIPVVGMVRSSTYVGSAPGFAQTTSGSVLHLPLDGRSQFKIGYKALCMTGRMGYLGSFPDSRAYLIIRNFFNDPANVYVEEPPDQPGNRGHSVHVYNDGGTSNNGQPFCEMECSGRSIGTEGTVGRRTVSDALALWTYVGKRAQIDAVARDLLGSTT